jgi:DNA-binding NarL/FixJ family response regulator
MIYELWKMRSLDSKAMKKRVAAHKRTWILKMADVYLKVFELLDNGLKQYKIGEKLNISQDTIRKARNNRTEIEGILNESQ